MQLTAYKIVVTAVALWAKSGAFEPEPPFQAVGEMSGADSQIESPRVVLVQDQSTWAAVWKDHRQATALAAPGVQNPVSNVDDRPRVDFQKYTVLCMFGGQSKNVAGFTLAEAVDHDGTAYVRIRPQVLSAGGLGLLQNAYMMLVLPRTKRKMIVQLDQTQLGGEGWRTLATFGPTIQEKTKF